MLNASLVPAADTTLARAAITTPGAGATITSVTPVAGIYEVEFKWFLDGTTETATSNIQIGINGVNYTGLPNKTGVPLGLRFPKLTLNGTNSVNIVATALATTGAVYTGQILVTRIG